MFHANDGWCFEGIGGGEVRIEKRRYILNDGKYTDQYTVDEIVVFNADTWASIVAFVSVHDDTGKAWIEARNFHEGKEVAGVLPT